MLGCPPPRIPVANEGLVRDPLLKMFRNPGGDWHPGQGDNPKYMCQGLILLGLGMVIPPFLGI